MKAMSSILLSPALSARERRALRRAVGLLHLDRSRFALAALAGTAGMASAVALSGVAAWLIARASQMPDVVALGVAPVAVRLFGISRSVLRYCERLVSHDTALRGMGALRTRLYESLASARTDTVAGLRRGDVLARVGSDIDAVGDLVVRAYLPAVVAAVLGAATAVGIGLVYWPAGLILATCLLLSGLGAPLATIRSARIAEQARQQQASELSADVLAVLEGAPELTVSGRLTDFMRQVASRETSLVRLRDRAAVPAAIAAALDTAAMGIAVVGNLVVGVGAVAAGQLGPVWLAVIVLVPLAAFEATTRPVWWARVVRARPSDGKKVPTSSRACSPSAISQIQRSPMLGRMRAAVSAWATWRTRWAMRVRASSSSAPESSSVVSSWETTIHCSRSRASRYRRAFSTATAAAWARVRTASASERVKPPGLSHR